MTTVAWDGKRLAADKMAVNNGAKHGVCTKVHKINGCLCAITGSYDVGMEMLHWFQEGAAIDAFPDIQADTNDASLIVITPERRITWYERSPHALIFEQQFTAAGSGRDFALAAMHLGCSAEEAVRVASMFDAYSGHGVDSISFD